MNKLMVHAATAANCRVQISCPSFEMVRCSVERIMREQHLPFRRALEVVKRDRNIRDLAERLGFGCTNGEVA